MEIFCDICEVGHERRCSHAEGRHYDVWGEGLGSPDYCPFEPALPFGPDPEESDEVHTS